MEIKYNLLFNLIDDPIKKSIINAGLSCNNTLFKEIKKTVPKNIEIPGFSNITKIAFKSYRILAEVMLKNKLFRDNKTARLLLKGYFNNNKKKKNVLLVSDNLINNGYEIIEPNFIGEKFETKEIHGKDIFIKGENSYFRPNGKQIEGVNDEETTIIAALLGWSVLSKESDKATNSNTVKELEDDSIQNEEKAKHLQKKKAERRLVNTNEMPVKGSIESRTKPEKDEIEQRIDDLKKELIESSKLLIKLSEDLKNGKIPDNYNEAESIYTLKKQFDKLIDELDFDNPEKINTIQDLEEEYKRIKEKKSKELYSLVIDVLNRYRKIYHIKGEDFSFFNELNNLAEEYENIIKSNELNQDEKWFLKFKDRKHLFNHLNKAVEIRLDNNYNEQELDKVLDQMEAECTENNFDFYKVLSRQINRGNLAFREDKKPSPPEKVKTKPEKKKTESETINDSKEPVATEIETKTEPEIKKEKVTQVVEKTVEKESESPISKTEENHEAKQKINIKEPAEEPKIEKPEKGSEKETISEEDYNIIKLLERDEPELAYHLAICYEEKEKNLLLPSWLLENLFLSLKMRSSYASVAQEINSNLEKYNFQYNKSEVGELVNNLVFASILRPSLLAYNSGAGIILEEVHSGKMSQFNRIKKLISEFMNSSGGILNFESLTRISNEQELVESRAKFKKELNGWLERARNLKYRNKQNHFYSRAFNGWVKKGGWLSGAIVKIESTDEVKFIHDLLKNELNEDTWKKRFEKELKTTIGKKQYRHGNTDADKWVKTQIDTLKELLSTGLTFYKDVDINSQDYYNLPSNLSEFVSNVIQELERLKEIINDSINKEVYNNISALYLNKAVENVIGILSSSEQIGEPIEEIGKIKNKSLLKLTFYNSLSDWSPCCYDDNLSSVILEYLNKPKQTINEIAKEHLENGNFEAFNRIREVFVTDDEVKNVITNDQDYYEKADYEIYSITALDVEKGCAYGLITDGQRSSLLAKIETIAENHRNNIDGINFPLLKHQLHIVKNEMVQIKKEHIKSAYEQIPENIKKNEKDVLIGYLEKENLLVFNEMLDRIKKGQNISSNEIGKQEFKDFYKSFLSTTENKNFHKTFQAIKERSSIPGVDFSLLTENQSKEAYDLLSRWYSIPENWGFNDTESLKTLNFLLDFVGFGSPKINQNEKYNKAFYFDFKCNLIHGRNKTPLPQFGSVAKGNYRLICIKESRDEVELIDQIKELSPETNRAVIVFYFSWLDQQSRLEISKLSKRKRATFLILDTATLIYLFGVKEKFSTLVKLAAPITFAEPYQTASSNLPEEMFYGRKPQIEKLKNIIGNYSCLIYGGRQLGKTVLQREVGRIFHNPELNHFSIYIDLRNSGIGLWNPIEKLPSVLYENLKNIPGLFPEKIPANFGLPFLQARILEWFDRNQESRIILFLDESDKFLEQDAEKHWAHILPLKGIMEKTDKRFKVVLAGLHDVRRTIKIANNPLAHFGSPICVGSMLEGDEAIEAQKLIRLPLETLGFEFESDDLVFMILSYCNWYPSLIQIFCSSLLNLLNKKTRIKELPIVITDKDVTKAHEKSQEQIKEKFKLTLNLDERYDLLTNLIAWETIQNPSYQIDGIPVEEISDLAFIAWDEGFDSINPKIDVNNLLEEMVDLGILRIETPGKYAIRTPNLIGLLGSEKEIKDNINKVREIPQEFKREVSRIIYKKKGNRELRSPFPAIYYDLLHERISKVIVFRGSKMGGIGFVEEFLQSKKKEINLIFPDFTKVNKNEIDQFWQDIDKKRISGLPDIILFKYDLNYSFEDILLINSTFGKREFLTVIFLMDPPKIWEIISDSEKSFDLLEIKKVQVINLPQWKEGVAREWVKDVCTTADIVTIFDKIGNWHYLLNEYHERIMENPDKWVDILNAFADEKIMNNKEILEDFGLLNEQIINVIRDLIIWDDTDDLTRQGFLELSEEKDAVFMRERILDYLMGLNLINKELKVNNVIKTILNNE